MQQHQLYYGKGDFKSIVETLIQKHPQNAQFKELGLKLGMIKHGYISKEILDEKKNEKPENAVKLHYDSDGQGGRIKRPNVHKIFQTHCYEGQAVSQEEMDKLFPEYKEEMEIWRLQQSQSKEDRTKAYKMRVKRRQEAQKLKEQGKAKKNIKKYL